MKGSHRPICCSFLAYDSNNDYNTGPRNWWPAGVNGPWPHYGLSTPPAGHRFPGNAPYLGRYYLINTAFSFGLSGQSIETLTAASGWDCVFPLKYWNSLWLHTYFKFFSRIVDYVCLRLFFPSLYKWGGVFSCKDLFLKWKFATCKSELQGQKETWLSSHRLLFLGCMDCIFSSSYLNAEINRKEGDSPILQLLRFHSPWNSTIPNLFGCCKIRSAFITS